MTHRDRVCAPSGRRGAAGDAVHRQGVPTHADGSHPRSLWVIISAPWYYAADSGRHRNHPRIARLLLSHGARTGTRDRWGRRALDYALRRGGNDAIAKMLREKAPTTRGG